MGSGKTDFAGPTLSAPLTQFSVDRVGKVWSQQRLVSVLDRSPTKSEGVDIATEKSNFEAMEANVGDIRLPLDTLW